MVTALNIHATEDFIYSEDKTKDGKPKADATVFKIGSADSYVQSHIQGKASSYSIQDGMNPTDLAGMSPEEAQKYISFSVDAETMAIEGVRLCLKGFENFKDAEGNDLQFKTQKTNIKGRMYDAVHPDIIAQIPQPVLQEMYQAIVALGTLSGAARKNSSKG